MDNSFLHSKRLLLVDDEQELLKMVTDILKDAGFETVLTAASVKEAVMVAKQEKPDLMILDVMLPDGDGFSLMEQLRTFTDVPVIFLTAKDEAADKLAGLGLGADDYISKPFMPQELLLRIYAVLRRTYKEDSPLVVLNTEWGDFGHINQPVFSIPGMIYGAVWSWGENVPDYQELNRQISVLEYGDVSGRLLSFLGRVNGQNIFKWYYAVSIKEGMEKNIGKDKLSEIFWKEDLTKIPECNRNIQEMMRELCIISRSMDSRNREILECIQVSMEATWVWNEVGMRLHRLQKGERPTDGMEIAGELEKCLHSFQELWRRVGKEADLAKVSEVFYWYADVLREI